MNRIVMLGTGAGFNKYFYNTCFVLDYNNKKLLVDTGGSIEIFSRLTEKNIELTEIQDIFISHSHNDHIFGLFWLLKGLSAKGILGKVQKLNIYCNQSVCEAIKGICNYTLPKRIIDKLNKFINYVVIKPGDRLQINGLDFSFFDSFDQGNNLTCFETNLDGKSLVFLGDATCYERNYEIVKNKDYVMHEAFCLDKDADIFKPYEKHHSTVKSVCECFKNLNIKNLILYHSIDEYEQTRKKEYINEAESTNYKGNVLVPDDMEEIII